MLKLLVVLSVLLVLAYSAFYEDSALKYAGDHGLWTAGYNQYFAGYTKERIQRMMGTRLDKRPGTPGRVITGEASSLPNFNSATRWPNCASTVSFIKDQADCGSCWAVSASEVVSSRTCIAEVGDEPPKEGLNEPQPAVDMSAEELMSCCKWCGQGCQGGYPIEAMRFWCWSGLVTGGWYGSNCGCQPYSLKPCGIKGCKGPIDITPKCHRRCRKGYPKSFKNDKHRCKDHYEISNKEEGIMNEIAKRGPVECAFSVYENFMHYKAGIYNETTGGNMGGHAVTVVGWGTDPKGEKYWIINNSWNTTWGMNGVFWFKRGTNLCGMEGSCVAGTPKKGDGDFNLKC